MTTKDQPGKKKPDGIRLAVYSIAALFSVLLLLFGPAPTQRRNMERANSLIAELHEQLDAYPEVHTRVSTVDLCRKIIVVGEVPSQKDRTAVERIFITKFADTDFNLHFAVEIRAYDDT